MIDWQAIAVAFLVLAALIYTGRRLWTRLRSFQTKRSADAPCETGCGSCGSADKPRNETPRTVFVEITRRK